MKEITIVSGKGGTGKTSITASLASLGKNLVVCDGDVDASDLHLLLHPEIKKRQVFESSWLAEIDVQACTNCGLCSDYCRFGAIKQDENGHLHVNHFKCEGCRLCERLCPSKAITSSRNSNNHWFISETNVAAMVHARMGPGEENSGKLVTTIRNKAKEIAREKGASFLLTDGPPGTGCPVIATLSGTDAVLLVIEPSITGMHDAERVIELTKQFKIPVSVVINKSDINEEQCFKIREHFEREGIPILGLIPYDPLFMQAMLEGKSLSSAFPSSESARILKKIWEQLRTEC